MSYKQVRPIPIAEGGTNATTMATTNGTVYYNGTNLVTTATGAANQVLTSNGAGLAPTYQDVSASGAVTSVSGGNNITITGTSTAPIVNVSGTTNHAVQVGNATGSLTSLPVGTTGQLLVGSSGADPAFAASANGDFSFTSSTAAVNRTLTASNTDNTSGSSQATIIASTGGASSGDARYQATTTATTWTWGCDNSASDAFVVSQGTALGTNDTIVVNTAGSILTPLQPIFYANLSATQNNVTGDGTVYTLIADTEIIDQQNSYNNATGIFTAPVTGTYHFVVGILLTSIGAGHTAGLASINLSAGADPRLWQMNPAAVATSGTIQINGSAFARMTAGDTAVVLVQISNSTLTVDLTAAAGNALNFFGGYLVG